MKNDFERTWLVTYVRPAVNDAGKVYGYEVSLYSPIMEEDKLPDEYIGLAKSVFVVTATEEYAKKVLPFVGEFVRLGFNRAKKSWYIKKQ